MYAVIRAGGKQFRVAPGDVIKVDQKPAENGNIEFTDVLAVSGEPGALVRPQSGARVVGSVVEQGRGDKILVFHFKRKKQYKKLQGHRQPFTRVRIAEISFGGETFKAPELPSTPRKEKKEAAAEAKTGPRAMKKKSAEAASESHTKHKGTKPARKTAGRKKA